MHQESFNFVEETIIELIIIKAFVYIVLNKMCYLEYEFENKTISTPAYPRATAAFFRVL